MKLSSSTNTGLRVLVTFLLCLNVSVVAISRDEPTRPEVTIPQGTAQGVIMKTKNNRSIAGFLGIPFGKPPIGDLRFKAPVAAEGWDGILDAGKDSEACIQTPDGKTITGSEDCLYINVYTPKVPTCHHSAVLLPVMVWIYGGSFIRGSNNSTLYGPTFLLDKDILLVVPNYRVGALGFLSTGDAVAPGNWGFKDQILALKWVQKNIKHFGGDPHQVTLAGNSAGSVAVTILALSNLTKGLFHRYISQSGVATTPLSYQGEPAKRVVELGKYLGCPTHTSAHLIKCLRKTDASDIIKASSIFVKWQGFPIVIWGVAIEPKVEGAVLTDNTANLLKHGKIRDIPAMVGSVKDDGFALTAPFYNNPDLFAECLSKFVDDAPYVFSYYDKSKKKSAITSALKSFYFNNDLTTNRTELLANFTLLAGDGIMRFPSFQAVQQNSPESSPWYSYSFEYRGTLSYSYVYSGSLTFTSIVCHEDDLLYIFSRKDSQFFRTLDETMSNTDLKMVDRMVELWTSFVITGVPYSTALGHKSWPRYSKSKQYLRIGNGADPSLQIERSIDGDRAKFWERLMDYFI